ncbi:integrase family protein [Solidesulfovibrio fructosivorans JJ]]|uniref:Integrase family protein n=1 Tax=Solidesulfovibrio fructosivorans JJ] TaxID=596151 RepID=E1JRE1_SOLFR|nr:integrase family protein [Solidesulfovibrio fructosivorans JJ]]
MARQWIKTAYVGVRYRKDGNSTDRYFAIRYRRDGILHEEGLGWASEGWNAKKASEMRAELQRAHTTGDGPATLAGKRESARIAAREQEQAEKQRNAAGATYKELVEAHYIPWAEREKKSAAADKTRLKLHIFPVIGALTLDEVTPQVLEALRDKMVASHCRATALQVLALVRKTFNHLGRLGLHTLRNPVALVKLPRLDNACERFFTHDEFDRFLAAAGKLGNPDLHDACILAVDTGLRLGELNRLMPADVNLELGFLTVREADGKPGGVVPLNSRVRAMLQKRLLTIAPGQHIFRTTRDGDREMSRRFTRLARALGLNDGVTDRRQQLTFHSLRHTFGSWLALADVELYRIQKLMRHKTPAMVQRYAHLRPSWLASDVEVLCKPPSRPDHVAD